MAQVPARKLPLEEFHQLTLTGDQLNTLAYLVRYMQDELEQARPETVEERIQTLEILRTIDEIMIVVDGLR